MIWALSQWTGSITFTACSHHDDDTSGKSEDMAWLSMMWSTVCCQCIFEFCISPTFFRITKKSSNFSWPKNSGKLKKRKCIESVVCGILFRFFWAIKHRKRSNNRIGIPKGNNFTLLDVFSLYFSESERCINWRTLLPTPMPILKQRKSVEVT